MGKVETYGMAEYSKGSLKKPDNLGKLCNRIKNFINVKPHILLSRLKSFINEYQIKDKLITLINPSFTGILLWYTISKFNSPLSYIFMVILFEHYLPFIVKAIKRKY